MSTESQYARWNDKWAGRFCVLSFQKAIGRYAPIGKRRYATIQQALAAASRLERGRRYRGQFLFVDIAA